jgi:hypothetical protein
MVNQLNEDIAMLTTIVDLNKLSSLADPSQLYHNLGQNVDLSNVTINKPEIRNHDGTLIHPREYSSKLKDGMIVGVQVYLKLLSFLSH